MMRLQQRIVVDDLDTRLLQAFEKWRTMARTSTEASADETEGSTKGTFRVSDGTIERRDSQGTQGTLLLVLGVGSVGATTTTEVRGHGG